MITNFVQSCSSDDSSFIDGLPDAVVNNDPSDAPPRVLEESWNDHSQKLYREYFDNTVAIYYDENVDRSIEWTRDFTSNAWNYVQNNFGSYGSGDVLYAVFHSEQVAPYSANSFEDETLNNFLFDLSLQGNEISSANTDAILKEISKIVETSAFGVDNSPTSNIWQDKWSEIFLYDVYTGLGMEDEAQRIHDAAIASSVNFPVEGTFWFRDWFLPLYGQYDGNTILNNYYRVLSQNFTLNGDAYARELTFGEFIHFYSGATGEDLQPMAEEVFGWSDEWQQQLAQARTNFPNLNYPFEPTSQLIDLTTDATLTVSKDNNDGPEGNEGSLKLVDNDPNSKYLTGDFSPDLNLWLQQRFPEAQVVNRYTLISGNDAPERDPKSWRLEASNDGENWIVLDTRNDETFSGRNQTREFNIDNEEAFTHYRLYITENNGSGLLQISEWRLFSFQVLAPSGPEDATTSSTLTVSRDNNGGAESNEGSLKLIDNDLNSKFLADYSSDFWMQQELAESRVVLKYSLTSGNDAPDRDPVDWEFSGSQDGSTWTVLDTRTGQSFAERNQTKDFAVDSDDAYKYYRLSVTANGGSGAIQISEWRIYVSPAGPSGPQDFTSEATLTVSMENGGGANGGEGSLKLIDNDNNTKFLASYSPDFWMQQELPEAEVVNKYTITSANDAPDRDPLDWTLSGSNDGSNWEDLDTRTGETFENRNFTRSFNVANTSPYKYYRLSVTANNGSDGIQISEWRLLND